MHSDLIELNQIRLEEDLPFSALAVRVGLTESALHRLLRGEREPLDRTLYKIRKYLDSRKAAPKRPRRRVA